MRQRAPRRLSTMVIVPRNRTVNRISRRRGKPANKALPDFSADRAERAFTSRSSRTLNCPSNLIGHDRLNKPANGIGE
jgi:hypothetical protein